MSLDIVNGDLLTIGGVDYPIRGVGRWPRTQTSAASFDRSATVAASTKRGAVSAGEQTPAVNLTGLIVQPLMPVDAETLNKLTDIASPHLVKQTFLRDGTEMLQLVVEVDV